MKRISVLVCILALAALPATVSAQGLSALGGFPGVGGIGSLFGSTGPCGEAKPALLAPPTLYVGWLGQGKGLSVGVGLDTPLAGISGVDHTYRLNGLALGISDMFRFSDRISILASGWWIVPGGKSKSFERLDAAQINRHRDWSADTNWWWVDALAVINISNGFAFLGGFRYDRLETRFNNSRNLAFPGSPLDEANVKSNGYIPLLGVLYTTGSAGNVLTAYAVGFPTLLGRAEHRETIAGVNRLTAAGDYNNGFFFETRLDYSRRVMGEADLGAFFRYNATRGNFSGTADLDPGGLSSSFRGGLTRTSISVGGLLTLPFRLPFM